MLVRKRLYTIALILAIAISPSVSHAAYTWPTVAPTSGGTGNKTSQTFGAIINWNIGDAPVTNIGAIVNVNSGAIPTVNVSTTSTIGSLTGTITGTVTFTPALPSGSQYTITIMASTGMSMQGQSIILNVP